MGALGSEWNWSKLCENPKESIKNIFFKKEHDPLIN